MTSDTIPTRPAVLVVYYDLVVRSVIGVLIRHSGFDALEAADGEEAVAAFRARPGGVALVLLGVCGDGREAEATLRKDLDRLLP